MQLLLHPKQLLLKEPFTIAHGTRTVQPSLIVELREGALSGFGEATATSYYGLTLDGMVEKMEQLRPVVEQTPLDTPESFWTTLAAHLPDDPFLLCALDEAAHDLHARRQGKPLYASWGLSLERAPLTNYTIGLAPIEEMVSKIKAMPWPVYKVKLGGDHDLDIVKALRQHTDAPFRVDANTAWTADQTIAYAPELQALGVEFIEQPLPADDWAGMARVFQECALPVIADESCRRPPDIDRCHGHFHGVNIKLMKCGGLTPARRMIRRARELELKVMVGCMTESSVGISAIAQLLPLLDYVDMDGALLLREDPARGVCIDYGKVHFPDLPGTGVVLD